MPTYEYVCDACEHRFELLQRMSEPAVRKCPSCRKLKVRRIISGGAGLIFKGSGFYITDYRNKRGGASGGSAESGSGGDASGGSPASPAKDGGAAPKADSGTSPAPKKGAGRSSGKSGGAAKGD